jgi:trigger factor
MECSSPNACSREYAFTLTADAAKAEADRTLAIVANMVQLPGFRPGKAPLGLVKSKYASYIDEELRNRIVSAAVEKVEAAKDELLSLNFKTLPEFKAGEEFKFVLAADVAPAIELGDYNAIKVDVPAVEVKDSEIDERIETYRGYGKYAEVEAPAVAGDMLKVDYESDFTPAEDANAAVKRQAAAKDSFLWLNEPELIPGSIKALTGAEKGKEYSFAAEYPADYREKELAGKTLNYKVTVQSVQHRGKLTDEEMLANTGAKTMDDLRAMFRKELEMEGNAKRRNEANEAVCKKLDEAAGEFDLPVGLLDAEIQKELQKMARETVRSEADAEKFKTELDAHKAEAEKAARPALRRMLILRKLAQLEKVTVSDEELNAQVTGMSRYYGYKPNALRETLRKSGAIEDLRFDILSSKALDKLVTKLLK